nr:alpha/beta hydrolase [Flavobacterium agricola]
MNDLYIEYAKPYPNKPTLVFLHDSLGCVELWRDFPNQIAEALQYNVLVYDRLGYGKSKPIKNHIRPNNYMELEAEILGDLLLALEVNEPILFGHSDGGTIALLTASKFPERIKAVIAEAAHIFVESQTLQGVQDAVDAYKTTNLPQRLAKYHGAKEAAIFKAWTETWLRPDYKTWNIEYLLPAITCPLLFIQGDLDEYGTLLQVEKTIAQVSGPAETYIIPQTKHTPHKENSALVSQKVIAYLSQL